MAPLAKTNHDAENCTTSVQPQLQLSVIAAPASVFSCAAGPSLMADTSGRSSLSSSSHSSTSSSTSSSTTTSSHNTTNKRASLTVLHNVGAAFRALLLVLQRNGVAKASIRELQQLILNERYLRAMEQAEVYVDCLSSNNNELFLESIILLFVAAWESLRDYSKTVFRETQRDYAKWETQKWVEFIESQTLSDHEQERRRLRQLQTYNPRDELARKLFRATRFKIDCEKGWIQTTEWARYLRAQQRRLIQQ